MVQQMKKVNKYLKDYHSLNYQLWLDQDFVHFQKIQKIQNIFNQEFNRVNVHLIKGDILF